MATRLTLLAIVALAAALRLWRLDQNGFGNEYYSAGVRSMATGWHNFLYHAFDPAGFISVDKPPVAMWIQVASVKLIGFHSMSVLLPQILEGLAAIWLVHHLVRRRFGSAAGLWAALFLAVTPVAVAVDRSSNTESCLVLVLLLAAWALTHAAETGSRWQLFLAMALVGLAFNVKMLAAFVVLPTFAVVYFLGAPVAWRRRLLDLTIAAIVLAVVSTSWVAVYQLTPPQKRPYAGTTDGNSILELVVGPYGIGRFVKQTRMGAMTASDSTGAADATATSRRVDSPTRTAAARLFVRTPVGPLRLAHGQLAGQVAWLFPLALTGVALGMVAERWRRPLSPPLLALVLWLGWVLTYTIVYSAAGGFFHYYYLATMAPALAALAGVGVMAAWRWYLRGGWRALAAPAALLLTAAWQLHIEASALRDMDGWHRWLHVALLGGVLLGAALLVAIPLWPKWRPYQRGLAATALGVGLAGLLVIPAAWALSAVLVPGNGFLPSADLYRLLDGSATRDTRGRSWTGDSANVTRLAEFLTANRRGERFLLSTSSTMLAAPIIIRTGEPVMARGGFHGLDPILTPEKLAAMVAAGEVRFVMLGDLSLVSRRLGAEAAGRPIAEWTRQNGTRVDPALWREHARGSSFQLYDLRPEAGVTARAAAKDISD